MASRNSLSKADWIYAGFRILTKQGPQAVKVEKIARDLKVSKGSFYWHFENAQALKHAMLAYWVDAGTKEVINDIQNSDSSSLEKYLSLGPRITDERDAGYGGILTEAAIRDWSRFDKDVAKAVRKVNKSRLNYLRKLFADLGFSETESKSRASIVYSALIGLEFLEHQNLASMKDSLGELMTLLLQTDRE